MELPVLGGNAAEDKGIQVTESAIEQIRTAMAQEKIPAETGGLRLGIQGGGCSGLSYSIRLDAHPRASDRVYRFADIRIFVDPKSFVYLNGVTLDYEKTVIRQGFNFVNPNAAKSCGCGTSFSV